MIVALLCSVVVVILVVVRGPSPMLGGALVLLGIGLAAVDGAAQW